MSLSIGNAQLLQAEIDESDLSFFRFSVHGSIKYLTIEGNIFSTTEMAFGPSLRSLLPEFPPGDWNDGLIAKDKSTGKPYFARAVRNTFPGVKNQWHEYSVDYSDIKVGKRLRTGIYEAQCPGFNTVVVAKFARFHWEIRCIESETTAYEWIKGHDIGPRFLGHLVEDGRVIGFLMERISNARHAVLDDLEACWDTLSRLHSLGIRHGDTNRFNFLMTDSRAVLIDYDTAQKCNDDNVLCEELDGLAESLASTSDRGGGLL